MVKKYIIIILFIMFYSGCSSSLKQYNESQKRSHYGLKVNVLNHTSSDSLILEVDCIVPYYQFVFNKINTDSSSYYYEANVNVNLSITNPSETNQIIRDTWSEKIKKNQYSDTRNSANFIHIKKIYILKNDKYNVFLSFEDLDSHKNLKFNYSTKVINSESFDKRHSKLSSDCKSAFGCEKSESSSLSS